MRASLILALPVMLLAAACSSDPSPAAPAGTPTATASPRPNPTIITATEVTSATQPPDATSTSEPTATPSAQPSATATAVPGATSPAAPIAGDVEGLPFATGDVRFAAVASGFGFEHVAGRPALCPASAVPGQAFSSVSLDGGESGPLLVLWIYPDPDALRADWNVEPGRPPVPLFDCELPTGFVYWNENAVLALEGWLAAGLDVPIGEERPSEHPAIDGFLSLAR